MARKPVTPSFIPTPWHAAMWLLVSACLVLMIAVWYSGSSEAMRALEGGRRMIINISTGEIQGMKADGLKPREEVDLSKLRVDGALGATADALEAVDDKLLEDSEFGKVPAIAGDGRKSWRYYSRPFQHRGGLPMVAVVVGGLGHSKDVAEAAIKLPPEIALSFSPYAKDIPSWVKASRATGHEAMIDLPLHPNDYPATDPGPLALLTLQSADANSRNLEQIMALAQGYTGFLAPYNESYSENNDALKLLLQAFNNHGIMMVGAREPHKTETREIIDASNAPVVVSDIWIDEDPSETAINERLATLEQIAKKRGYSIGIAHGIPITIQQLRVWSAQAAEKGFVLVPVTFIAKPRFS